MRSTREIIAHMQVAAVRPPISVTLRGAWLVDLRVGRERPGRLQRAGSVVATGGRDDVCRENVQEEEVRVNEKDERQTPVDGQLQRRNGLSQAPSESESFHVPHDETSLDVSILRLQELPMSPLQVCLCLSTSCCCQKTTDRQKEGGHVENDLSFVSFLSAFFPRWLFTAARQRHLLAPWRITLRGSSTSQILLESLKTSDVEYFEYLRIIFLHKSLHYFLNVLYLDACSTGWKHIILNKYSNLNHIL